MKAITTKYLGPTNARGSRIKASDSDGNAVTVGYNYALSGVAVHFEAVKALCAKMGWTGKMAWGGLNNGYVFVWVDADTLVGDV